MKMPLFVGKPGLCAQVYATLPRNGALCYGFPFETEVSVLYS